MRRFFLMLIILLVPSMVMAEKNDSPISSTDISFLNRNTISYLKNLDISLFKNTINENMSKPFNDCYDYVMERKDGFPYAYLYNQCRLKYAYEIAQKQGFTDGLNGNTELANEAYNLIKMEGDNLEELSEVSGYYLRMKYKNQGESYYNCKDESQGNFKKLQECLYGMKNNDGNKLYKYVLVCDDIYNNQNDATNCISYLAMNSKDPFERSAYQCLNSGYKVVINGKSYIRYFHRKEYYQCLSNIESSDDFIVWKARDGYSTGYILGRYSNTHKVFEFLSERNKSHQK